MYINNYSDAHAIANPVKHHWNMKALSEYFNEDDEVSHLIAYLDEEYSVDIEVLAKFVISLRENFYTMRVKEFNELCYMIISDTSVQISYSNGPVLNIMQRDPKGDTDIITNTLWHLQMCGDGSKECLILNLLLFHVYLEKVLPNLKVKCLDGRLVKLIADGYLVQAIGCIGDSLYCDNDEICLIGSNSVEDIEISILDPNYSTSKHKVMWFNHIPRMDISILGKGLLPILHRFNCPDSSEKDILESCIRNVDDIIAMYKDNISDDMLKTVITSLCKIVDVYSLNESYGPANRLKFRDYVTSLIQYTINNHSPELKNMVMIEETIQSFVDYDRRRCVELVLRDIEDYRELYRYYNRR